VTKIQQVPPGLFFHPYVKISQFPDVTFKYGVTSSENLISDLTSWRHLYLAGRLQKPVRRCHSVLKMYQVKSLFPVDSNPEGRNIPEDIQDALKKNYFFAAAIALMLQEDAVFSESQVSE
jgi:hypothetical protein